MDSITAEEPETLRVIPLTERTVSVVRETSLNAAKASPGRNKEIIKPESNNFFMSMRYGLVIEASLADSPEPYRYCVCGNGCGTSHSVES